MSNSRTAPAGNADVVALAREINEVTGLCWDAGGLMEAKCAALITAHMAKREAGLREALEGLHQAGMGVLYGCQPLKDPEKPKLLPSQSYLENWRVRALGEAMQKSHEALAASKTKGNV